jgi:hypothetical protein
MTQFVVALLGLIVAAAPLHDQDQPSPSSTPAQVSHDQAPPSPRRGRRPRAELSIEFHLNSEGGVGCMQTNADLAQQLQELTGNLTAGPDGSEELERARRLVVQAMLRGQKQFLDSISMARRVMSREEVAQPSAQLLSIAAEESLSFKGAKAGAGVEVMLRATRSALGSPRKR